MEDNPYTALAGMMGEQSTGGQLRLRVGIVLSMEPPKIAVGGIEADGNMLRWNEALLAHDQRVRAPNGTLAVAASCGYGSHGSAVVSGGTLAETVTPIIKNGDSVLTLSEDDQTFFVLCALR